MKPSFKNQRGMTLVELLAALVIGAIIMIFVTSILTQSLNEQKRQATNNEQLTEMRYVLKLITKDMRKSTNFNKISDSEYKFTSPQTPDAIYKFDADKHLIMRNDVVIASNISELIIGNKDENGVTSSSIKIKIDSPNVEPIKTELYFRSGN